MNLRVSFTTAVVAILAFVSMAPPSLLAQYSDGFSPDELAVTAPVAPAAGGGTPAFDLSAFAPVVGPSDQPAVATCTNAVASGKRLVVAIFSSNEQGGISSVVDSGGNTYSSITSVVTASNRKLWLYSAPITTALTTSSTVTVTWVTPSYSYQCVVGFVLSGVTAVDVSATGDNDNAATVAAAATTTVSDTVAVGIVASMDASYASSNFDSLYSSSSGGGATVYAVKKVFTTSGSKDVGGTCTIFQGWSAAWVALKP